MADLSRYHDEKGKFKRGNPGGPGRPCRPIEQDYLRALVESVPMETWQRIINTAVAQAIDGDDKARTWLSKYLLGDQLPGLARLAALEAEEVDPVEKERQKVREVEQSDRHTRELVDRLNAEYGLNPV